MGSAKDALYGRWRTNSHHPHRVGRKLKFDAATESFAGDAEANALLAREYSKRIEMPSQV